MTLKWRPLGALSRASALESSRPPPRGAGSGAHLLSTVFTGRLWAIKTELCVHAHTTYKSVMINTIICNVLTLKLISDDNIYRDRY